MLNLLDQRRGGSLIRVGDGEGVLLSRADLRDERLMAYIATHFGPDVQQQELEELSDRLRLAIQQASVIGLRPDSFADAVPQIPPHSSPDELIALARASLPLRPSEKEHLDPDSAQRLLLLAHWVSDFNPTADTLLTNAWCHFDWLESGFLADLAVREKRIGLVAGRVDLAETFRDFGIEVDEWPVPLRHFRLEEGDEPHFPDRYLELLETLEPAFPGQLFFVGAGICGKIYCDVIARRGGVALDIGAVCDAWLGLSSRVMVSKSRWGEDRIPERLWLKHQLAERLGPPQSEPRPLD